MGLKKPLISVLIFAFNRKQYLKSAVDSVLNQTLEKRYYQIIVIKNFEDEVIDAYLRESGVFFTNINTHNFGARYLEGVLLSDADIICFLEDDDVFHESKLKSVYDIFMSDPSICYCSDDVIGFSKDEQLIELKNQLHTSELTTSVYINSNDQITLANILKWQASGISQHFSAISIRRHILSRFTKILPEIPFAQDCLTFLIALDSGFKVFQLSSPLTFYRTHESFTHSLGTYEGFAPIKRSVIKEYRLSYERIAKSFLHQEISEFCVKMALNMQLRMIMLGEHSGKKHTMHAAVDYLKLCGRHIKAFDLMLLSALPIAIIFSTATSVFYFMISTKNVAKTQARVSRK